MIIFLGANGRKRISYLVFLVFSFSGCSLNYWDHIKTENYDFMLIPKGYKNEKVSYYEKVNSKSDYYDCFSDKNCLSFYHNWYFQFRSHSPDTFFFNNHHFQISPLFISTPEKTLAKLAYFQDLRSSTTESSQISCTGIYYYYPFLALKDGLILYEFLPILYYNGKVQSGKLNNKKDLNAFIDEHISELSKDEIKSIRRMFSKGKIEFFNKDENFFDPFFSKEGK